MLNFGYEMKEGEGYDGSDIRTHHRHIDVAHLIIELDVRNHHHIF